MSNESDIKKRIRVGIVCSPWLGGSGVIATELGNALENRGWYVRYITFDRPFRLRNSRIRLSKVDVLDYPLFPHPLYQLPLTEKIISDVKKYKLEIIHCHYILPFGLAAIDAKSILLKEKIILKVVLTTHGSDILKLSREVPNIAKYVLNQADAITSVSQDLADRTKRVAQSNKEVNVIPNFVDLQRFCPLRKPRSKQEKIIVHMSNFRPIKRVGDIIGAFKKINEKIPSRLVLIGEGPDLSKVKEIAKLNGLSRKVSNLGKIKHPEKEIRKACLMLTTSEYESFCLANLEAMACGVPVSTYAVGGIPEVVEDGKNGRLSMYKDIHSLANNAIDILSDSNWKRYSENARKSAESYSVEKILPQYEQVYRKILRRNTG